VACASDDLPPADTTDGGKAGPGLVVGIEGEGHIVGLGRARHGTEHAGGLPVEFLDGGRHAVLGIDLDYVGQLEEARRAARPASSGSPEAGALRAMEGIRAAEARLA